MRCESAEITCHVTCTCRRRGPEAARSRRTRRRRGPRRRRRSASSSSTAAEPPVRDTCSLKRRTTSAARSSTTCAVGGDGLQQLGVGGGAPGRPGRRQHDDRRTRRAGTGAITVAGLVAVVGLVCIISAGAPGTVARRSPADGLESSRRLAVVATVSRSSGLQKVAVVGAGSVGAAVAYASMIDGVAGEIALYDINAARARAEVLDLRHGLQFVGGGRVNGGGDVAVCADADLIVVTAGAKQDPGQTRLALAEANVALIRRALPPLLDVAPDAVVLLVTNPVDVVTYVAQEISGLPSRPGDRQRHRARHVAAAPPARRAPRRGRHQRPRRSSSASTATARSCSGRRPPSAAHPCSTSSARTVNGSDPDERDGLLHEVRTAAYEIIAGKGATNLAIGLATARIVRGVARDERAVLPVSIRTDGRRHRRGVPVAAERRRPRRRAVPPGGPDGRGRAGRPAGERGRHPGRHRLRLLTAAGRQGADERVAVSGRRTPRWRARSRGRPSAPRAAAGSRGPSPRSARTGRRARARPCAARRSGR